MSELQNLLAHLFLPRKLPQTDIPNCHSAILQLLWQETQQLHQLHQLQFEQATGELTRMMDCWRQLQSNERVDSVLLRRQVTQLSEGQCLALYVGEQNATIFIERLHSSATVSWFQTSAQSDIVTESVGDLAAWYPTASVSVPHLGILHSQVLSDNLADLCNNAIADCQAHARKAGREFVEVRQVATPSLVSEWLMAILCGDGSVLSPMQQVSKKIRDEVLWKSSYLPFRRSGLYFSIKVVLHIRLSSLLGQQDGTLAYKMLILSALHTVCKDWWQNTQNANKEEHADLAIQLLAKLARRSHKLEQLCELRPADDDGHLLRTVRKTLKTVASTVTAIRSSLDSAWNQTVNQCRSASAAVPAVDIESFDYDRQQSLATAKREINRLNSLASKQSAAARIKDSRTRNCDSRLFADMRCLNTSDEVELGIALIDVERWLQAQSFTEPPRFGAEQYYTLFSAYLDKATPYYQDDAVGTSRMVLAGMRAVIEMDRLSSANHDLLLQYTFGADTKQLELLHLVNRDELDYMFQIRDYIAKRNQQAKYGTSLLNEQMNSSESFGVKYAQSDSLMVYVEGHIEAYVRRMCDQKLSEVRDAKEKYNNLMKQANERNCEYQTVLHDYRHPEWGSVQKHSSSCHKCRLEKQARQLRVSIYEKPLPPDDAGKKAVIFELRIPHDLALLRDALHLLHDKLLLNKCKQLTNLHTHWFKYPQLVQWDSFPAARTITLGSTVKPVSRSHYNINQQIYNPNEAFITENGMNLVIAASSYQATYNKCSEPCSRFTNAVAFPYLGLKWTIEKTDHNENQVLCRQTECPHELSLAEFQVFGCLRAGHRTQLHNVLDALEARSLSFKDWSVTSLVLQAIYQVGPMNRGVASDAGNSATGQQCGAKEIPEAHESLCDSHFVLVLLDVLSSLLEEIADNWRDHMTLLLIICLTARVLSLCASDMQKRAEQVLLRCREISTAWEQKVAAAIAKADGVQQSLTAKMRQKLAVIAAGTVLTFVVDSKHILLDESCIPTWLQSNARIIENVLLVQQSPSASKAEDSERLFVRNLLRRVRLCHVQCEGAFFGSQESLFFAFDSSLVIKQFIDRHWPDGKTGTICNVKRSGWWISFEFQTNGGAGSTGRKNLVQVSLDGHFLVDGLPVGKLPRLVQNDALYKRVFHDAEFDVQPSASSPTAMVTVQPSRGNCFYTFQMVGSDLLVTERDESNAHAHVESLLLPHTLFKQDLPETLYTNYSHWLNRRTKVVSFRPIRFTDKNFNTAVDYTLDLNSSLLQRCKTGEYLLDNEKTCFKQLYNAVFYRLERKQHVHVFYNVDEAQPRVFVELPRFGLHFQRTKTSVHCLDYQDMQVAACQKLGTLIGLEQGLLLVAGPGAGQSHELDSNQSMLLVPHAEVTIASRSRTLELDRLRSPALFAYAVDNRLRQLKAPQSDAAVLYLAYLHAATSFVLADPFSALLGSERALQILQSAACFSCKPFEPESQKTLQLIAELSPTRSYYPPHLKVMQSIDWPQGVYPTQALEAYRMLAHKLELLSLRTAFAFGSVQTPIIEEPNNLNYRAFYRSAQQNRLLTNDWLNLLEKKPPVKLVYPNDYELGAKLQSVRLLAAHLATPAEQLPNKVNLQRVDLVQYFKGLDSLRGINPTGSVRFQFSEFSAWLADLQSVSCSLSGKLKQEWLALCDFALSCASEDDVLRLVVYLSRFAFKQCSITELLPLLVIAKTRTTLQHLKLPPYGCYTDTSQVTYDEKEIENIIKRHSTSFNDYWMREEDNATKSPSESYYGFMDRLRKEHSDKLNSDCNKIQRAVNNSWRNSTFVYPSVLHGTTEVREDVCSELQSMLTKWRTNSELHSYLTELTTALNNLQLTGTTNILSVTFETRKMPQVHEYFGSSTFSRLLADDAVQSEVAQVFDESESAFFETSIELQESPTATLSSKTSIIPVDIETTSESRRTLLEELQTSWTSFLSKHEQASVLLPSEQLLGNLLNTFEKVRLKKQAKWQVIVNSLSARKSKAAHCVLQAAGLWPPIVPSTVLPCICPRLNALAIPERVRQLVMQFVLLTVYEQRVARCVSYCRAGQGMRVQLERELHNALHVGWSPQERPEWLLFELENNLAIRPVQAKVANQMIDPSCGQNSVLQLNMGEGKTVVIVPIVLIALGDERRLARLTVLKPLLKMNFNALKHKLGWLLNRRVYYMPVSRDVVFSPNSVQAFGAVLEECKATRGVYVTLPEYRNSFKLKCLEKSASTLDNYDAEQCLDLYRWLELNARDILDESDEILHVRFQLIYTLDEQSQVDGGQHRWKLAEAILKLAAEHATAMAQRDKDGDLEKHIHLFQKRSTNGGYPTVRLLSGKFYPQLCERICCDILDSRSEVKFIQITKEERDLLQQFILQINVDQQVIDRVKESFEKHTDCMKLIQLLRGILSYGVLSQVLSKRWRVNYGVNDRLASKGIRAMAVPFRGKDMPSDRAEFGHPDVAIMFTILSYYYSGLSNKQLQTVFEKLKIDANCDKVYSDLMKQVRARPSVREYSGVNLDDVEQKRYLFNLLRYHPPVIDYFMNKTVFPKEAKAFPTKLVSSAWDLAEKSSHPTTGFSGTNETKLLLPLTISQNDLTELQQTNGMMIASLLRKENDDYDHLQPDATGVNILASLCDKQGVRVLLDVGGLILDMDNRTVVQTWLRLTQSHSKEITAALYFNSEDELCVLDRDGRNVRFDLSPHKNGLDKCVIYLDDAHTRGTDLRFPHGFRACVTLGKGVTKDRLVQACMRMRLLGHGHSVSFLASYDVHLDISTLNGTSESLGSRNVLNWALRNSGDMVEDGFVQWSSMAASYLRRLNAYEGWKQDGHLSKLASDSREAEACKIEQTYPLQRAEVSIPDIAASHFSGMETFRHTSDAFELKSRVVDTCVKYVSNIKRYSCLLSEEQERELECELENEKQVQRPGQATPHTPTISQELIHFARTGSRAYLSSSILRFDAAFNRTSLQHAVEADGWLKHVHISSDFVSVLKQAYYSVSTKLDDYLRSPRWVLSSESKTPCFVVVSQYEANELWPIVRKSEDVKLRLFTATRRHSQRSLFDSKGVFIGNSSSFENGYASTGRTHTNDLSQVLAQLNVFAGSLYFNSHEDQENWLAFLGLCPSPRSAEEQELFDIGLIERDGFMNATCRQVRRQSRCTFQRNPASFVRRLIEIRNFHSVHESSHVMTVLVDGKRPFCQA